MESSEQIEKFRDFIDSYYKRILHEIVQSGKRSLILDFKMLSEFDVDLAESLLADPENLVRAAEHSLELFDLPTESLNLRIRFTNLPDSQTIRISDIREKNLNKFVCIEGIVRQASDVRPQVVQTRFECPNCGNIHNVTQFEERFRDPTRCSCGRRSGFRLLSKILVDAQHLIIEEAPENLMGGEQPKRLTVFLREDLVEPKMEKKTTPGSKVAIYGVIKESPIFLKTGKQSTRYLLAMDANYIEPREESYEDIDITREEEEKIIELSKDPNIYTRLINSIAPYIFGHNDIKEALVLQLMSGVKKKRKDGTETRGDMHILLVGDPGAAKTTLLMYMAKAAPKARYVAGKGASAAGLCVAPDSLIPTNPGGLYDIKSLVESRLENNSRMYHDGVWQASDPKTDKKIFTLDKDFKIKPSVINQFWRISPPEYMVKLITSSGKEIVITPNTRLFSIKNGSLVWKKAEFIDEGDYLAACREFRFEGRNNLKNENKILILNLIRHSNPIIYGVKKDVKEMINKLCIMRNLNIRQLAKELNIKENNLYYNWVNDQARGNITLKNLFRLIESSKYSIELVAKHIKSMSLRKGHKIKVPLYLDGEFMYMAGLVAGDGDLGVGYIRFSNNSKELQNKFKKIVGSLFGVKCGISSKRSEKRAESWRFSSRVVVEVLEFLGISKSPKSHRLDLTDFMLHLPDDLLKPFLSGYFDSDASVVERVNGSSYIEIGSAGLKFIKKLQLVLLRFGIQSKFRVRIAKQSIKKDGRIINAKYNKNILIIRGKNDLELFRNRIGFYLTQKRNKLNRVINSISVYHTNLDVIPGINKLIKRILKTYGLASKKVFGYKTSSYFSERFNISIKNLKKIMLRLNNLVIDDNIDDNLKRLNLLVNSDIIWERVVNREVVYKHGYDFVYDLTVDGSHNFIVNGFVVHNTASVVRDEVLKGWALEAGALVLANGGHCMIDEMDKMDDSDRSAMHEALAQQRVTISKASIQATLKAETTVLAAANPKFGRFDQFKPIASQIDLPPTLINRFDLIFPVMDNPNRFKDDKIASHVLNLQKNMEGSEPDIGVDLLKKYVAYSRQKIFPVLSDVAIDEIKSFYVNLRNKDIREEGEIKPIPISARQLEALVRLAESSARVRLSKTVTRDDAKRAIRLLKHCLMQVGFDYETQTFDIDMISTGVSTSERRKIDSVREIIEKLHKEKGFAPIDLIYDLAKEKKIEREKVDETIEKLKQKGDVFEPKPGQIHKL